MTNTPTPKRQTLALFALLVAAAGIALAAYIWEATQRSLQQNMVALTAATQNVKALQQQLTAVQQQNADAKVTLQKIIQTNSASQINMDVTQARLAVFEADIWLRYYHNVPTSLALLQSADVLLARSLNANVLVLRQALAEDITKLNAIPPVDKQGIFVKLQSINSQLSSLPLVRYQATLPAVVSDVNLPMWRKILNENLAVLKSLIVIRRDQHSLEGLVNLPQLQETLHTQLMAAQWALLSNQETIYHEALKAVIQRITNNYDVNDALTKSLLQTLTQLNAQTIDPPLPTLSSLNAFQAKA